MGAVMADTERRSDEETRELVNRVAKAAASEAVPQAIETTLRSLGLDTGDPLTMQKNMAFLDESRKRCEKFYGAMWDNLNAMAWRGVKIVFCLALLGGLAAMGLNIDGMKSVLIGWLS